MTELALIKLTRPETATDADALLSRIERLERNRPRDGAVTPVAAPQSEPSRPTAGKPDEATPPTGDETATGAEGSVSGPAISLEQLRAVWPGLFGTLRDVLGARRWAFFREAVPGAVEGDVIVLEVAHDFHLQSLQEDDAVSRIVATRAEELLGSPVQVRFALSSGVADGGEEAVEIDMNNLEDRPKEELDPISLLSSELGAEVIEE